MSILRKGKVTHTSTGRKATYSVEMPADPTETDLIEKRYGTIERVFDCANRQWTVDFANNGGRDALGDQGAEALKKRAETWCNDGSGSGAGRVIVKPVSIKDEDREKFDDEQRKMLRETYGIDI